MLALAMVVSWRTVLCSAEDPCALAVGHSCIIEISSWMGLIAEGSGMNGISKRPDDLSGTGYHDLRLVY